MTIDVELLMRAAIREARAGIAIGQSPFGCAIALPGAEVVAEHNRVWQTCDITAHAEIVALRAACQAAKDVHLAGAIVATTCEPCPMCMSALAWAQVAEVHYGATISDARAAGFNELNLSAVEVATRAAIGIRLVPGLLPNECVALFEEWRRSAGARAY